MHIFEETHPTRNFIEVPTDYSVDTEFGGQQTSIHSSTARSIGVGGNRYSPSCFDMLISPSARFTFTLRHADLGVFGEVVNAEHQLYWVAENVKLLRKCGAFEPVYTLLRSSCKWMESDE